jgi:hypothetical protein
MNEWLPVPTALQHSHQRNRERGVGPLGVLTLCVASALLLLASIAGCGSGSTSNNATSPGQQIIVKARAAHLLDATFTITWTDQEAATGAAQQFTGQGKVTLHPYRSECSMQSIDGYPTNIFEDIIDYTTKAEYLKSNILDPTGPIWRKSTRPPRAFDLTAMPLIYPQLTNATLAGTDHMNSIAVWHIHGTLTAADSFYTGKTDTAVLDVYLRQDNYLPVKLLAHVTTPDTIQDDTFVYTAFNTGVTILLPTVGQ